MPRPSIEALRRKYPYDENQDESVRDALIRNEYIAGTGPLPMTKDFREEWYEFAETRSNVSLSEFVHDYDEKPENFPKWKNDVTRILSLGTAEATEIPEDMLLLAWEWATMVEDMDWAKVCRLWRRTYYDLGIRLGYYREFTDDDKAATVWSSSTGRHRRLRPDFKHRGRSWIWAD